MKRVDLIEHSCAIATRHAVALECVEEIDAAPSDEESENHQADAYTEALFLRAFTAYENDIEKLFLHYVTGGPSLNGSTANSYLRVTDEEMARQIIRAGWRFLSWAKPTDIRSTAKNYIENGWPISDMMSANSKELSDCERVRNRIAHNSVESRVQFNVVQRNLLQTERLFPITPGQLLRIRSIRLKKLFISHYLDVMNDTLSAIIDPPL